jgi:hypothetical protein
MNMNAGLVARMAWAWTMDRIDRIFGSERFSYLWSSHPKGFRILGSKRFLYHIFGPKRFSLMHTVCLYSVRA